MTDDSLLPFDLPAVFRKKVTAAFDGGLISSDGGLVLLREAERRVGLAELLADCHVRYHTHFRTSRLPLMARFGSSVARN